jgi:ferric-dicitrate binding protein FerR (iron transport regulator)
MNTTAAQQFYDLLGRKLSGDATPAELLLLQDLLVRHPQWQFLYDQMLSPASPLRTPEQTDQAYAAHFVKMQLQGLLPEQETTQPATLPAPSLRRFHSGWKYAAVAAVIAGVVFFTGIWQQKRLQTGNEMNEIATRKGSRSNIRLTDGTQVWLNADSKLTYAASFSGKTREVVLTGEAYFDVAHDSTRPFIIHTGKANIRVLGTTFNVRNYPQENALEATLMRGKIEVSFTDRPNEKIILKPLEKIVIAKEQVTGVSNTPVEKIVVTSATYADKDSVIAETAWMSDKMVFINQPLERIAQELERSFGITITFKTAAVKDYRYTGVFDQVSLEKIMQIIQLSKKIKYTIIDKQHMTIE